MNLNRRKFVKTTSLASAAISTIPLTTIVPRSVRGSNDRISLAVIGCGRMGRHNLEVQKSTKMADIAAVCDVYEPNLNEALQQTDGRAKAFKDFRDILDRKDIDAVVISTPDHWHALMTTMACEAGKDVFVEKPACVTVNEGRQMVNIARRTKRIVQVGTMQRSAQVFQNAVRIVQSGAIGKVSLVRTWICGNDYPQGIGNPPDEQPPGNLDWDFWLGPAPKRPFNWNRFGVGDRWSTFRYFWDYAGGMMTDWGVHLIDIVLWAMNEKAPKVVQSTGGKFFLQDNRETPDTLHVSYQFDNFVLTFTNQECNDRGVDGMGYGIEFYGSSASLAVDRGGYKITPQEGGKFDRSNMPDGLAMKYNSRDGGNEAHAKNFLECIINRQPPICDIETGHRSTSICLLGNIAYRTAERLEWDGEKEIFTNSEKANEYKSREYRSPWKLPET